MMIAKIFTGHCGSAVGRAHTFIVGCDNIEYWIILAIVH